MHLLLVLATRGTRLLLSGCALRGRWGVRVRLGYRGGDDCCCGGGVVLLLLRRWWW